MSRNFIQEEIDDARTTQRLHMKKKVLTKITNGKDPSVELYSLHAPLDRIYLMFMKHSITIFGLGLCSNATAISASGYNKKWFHKHHEDHGYLVEKFLYPEYSTHYGELQYANFLQRELTEEEREEILHHPGDVYEKIGECEGFCWGYDVQLMAQLVAIQERFVECINCTENTGGIK
jgi:hypothetical protein